MYRGIYQALRDTRTSRWSITNPPKMSVPTAASSSTLPVINGGETPGVVREARRSQERKRLFDSIESSRSNSRRYSAGDSRLQSFIRDPQSAYPLLPDNDGTALEPLQEESPRDPRDGQGSIDNRAMSPYTKFPTVDFDGLSWPSRLSQAYEQNDY